MARTWKKFATKMAALALAGWASVELANVQLAIAQAPNMPPSDPNAFGNQGAFVPPGAVAPMPPVGGAAGPGAFIPQGPGGPGPGGPGPGGPFPGYPGVTVNDTAAPTPFGPVLDDRTASINAWNDDRQGIYTPASFVFNIEGLTMFTKAMRLPIPLQTSGPLFDPATGNPVAAPGVIGQPGTKVIVGNSEQDLGASAGLRFRMLYWLVDPELFGIEASFMIMEQRAQIDTNTTNPTGDPVVVRPFFNPNTKTEDAFTISNPAAALFLNTLSDQTLTRLMGGEINFRWNLSGPNSQGGPHWTMLVGPRWFSLQEKYQNFDSVTNFDPVAGAVIESFNFHDNFSTYNRFFGGQVGMNLHAQWDRMTFDGCGKLGFGANSQQIQVSGYSQQFNSLGFLLLTDNRMGSFAQPTNIGGYSKTAFSMLPELNFNFGFEISERIKLTVGYNVMWLTNVVRPGDQIDRTVNPQALGTTAIIPPFFPAPPTFQQTDFWVQWVNVGLEFLF